MLALNVFFRFISGNSTSGVYIKTAIGVCQWIHTGYFSIGSGGGLAPCVTGHGLGQC